MKKIFRKLEKLGVFLSALLISAIVTLGIVILRNIFFVEGEDIGKGGHNHYWVFP